MDIMFWVWLGVIVVTFIVECSTMELMSIWFTIGAIIPFILAGTNAVGWEIQLVIFVVVSAILIATLRRVAKKWLLRNTSKDKLNTYIGNHVKMLDDLDGEDVGHVKINGVVWTAISENGEKIKEGQLCESVKISGNKVSVKKIKNKEKK